MLHAPMLTIGELNTKQRASSSLLSLPLPLLSLSSLLPTMQHSLCTVVFNLLDESEYATYLLGS